MAEITPTGYKLKTQNEWFDEERSLYLAIDPNWNLDPSTPDGLKMASDAEIFSALDETLFQAYNSKDPAKAVGDDLDIIGLLTGAIRSEGTRSSVDITLTGTPGSVIPLGTIFESATTGSRWITEVTYTLDGAGTEDGTAFNEDVGQVQADPNTITKIATTVAGLMSVTNPTAATKGTDRELNSSFRIKRAASVGRPGNNQIDSLYGEIYAIQDVRRAAIYENDTNSSSVSVDNPHGLPAHSLSIIVDGGSDDDVAMAIYIKKNPGVLLNQSGTPVSVVVTSPTVPTNKKTIKFARPIYVDMTIDLTIFNDGSLPANIEDLIKEAYVDFGAGSLIDPSVGFKSRGFDIGEDVPYATMFTPANKVVGAYGNSYVVSMDVNGGTSTVDIDFDELTRWTSANINVTITT